MAFPQSLDPTTPLGSDSPRLGDDQIRAFKQLLADLFTLPVAPSTISATIGSVSTAGKLTITNGTWAGDAIGFAYGGTGLSSGTSGGVLGFTAAGTLASSIALTANAIVLGGGAGATPTVLGSLGTTTTVLHGNAAGAPTFGAVSLTADVTGILPGANGGTANGFFAVAGPATSLKTFTFPNASDTVATLGVANIFTAAQTLSLATPSFIMTDTTAAAKSLTVAVGANIANFRESAGASGSLLVLDLVNNRVGIGTTGPNFPLEVTGTIASVASGATGGTLQLGNSVTSQNAQLLFSTSGDNNLDVKTNYSAGTGNRISFFPGGTERVRFQQNGNVSIGTVAPSGAALLNVNPVPSTNWTISGANSSSLVTIADNSTYDLAVGSGLVLLNPNNADSYVTIFSAGTGTTNIISDPGGIASVTQGTANKINFYYNAGTGKYRIENKRGASRDIYMTTIMTRPSS